MLKIGKYEHYKGGQYEILGIAKHSESMEEFVVYKALYEEGDLWIRPLKMFLEKVEINGKRVPRFKYVGT